MTTGEGLPLKSKVDGAARTVSRKWSFLFLANRPRERRTEENGGPRSPLDGPAGRRSSGEPFFKGDAGYVLGLGLRQDKFENVFRAKASLAPVTIFLY